MLLRTAPTTTPEEFRWHHYMQTRLKTLVGCRAEVRVSDTFYKKRRFADIINAFQHHLELQHSLIGYTEVKNRMEDFKKEGYSTYWLLDATDWEVERSNVYPGDEDRLLVTLHGNFVNMKEIFRGMCTFVFGYCRFEDQELILKIDLQCIQNQMVYVRSVYPLETFLMMFEKGWSTVFQPLEARRERCWTVEQKPPGSGKTYGIIEKIVNPAKDSSFGRYSQFLILTKPHSAKEVVKKELDEQLQKHNISFEHDSYRKGYWYHVTIDGKKKLVILATGDSFMYSLKKPSGSILSGLDMFKDICTIIGKTGKEGLNVGRNGYRYFTGCSTYVNAKMMIIWDEATKFDTCYADALSNIMYLCMADAYVVGDLLQSIEMEQNMLRYLLEYPSSGKDDPFPHIERIIQKDNVIRRFGPHLVKALTAIVKPETYVKYHLSVPVPCTEVDTTTVSRESSLGEIQILQVPEVGLTDLRGGKHKEHIEKAVNIIWETMEDEMDRLCLLPNDILCIFPTVLVNPFADFLRDYLDDKMIQKMEEPEYRTKMTQRHGRQGEDARTFFEAFDRIRQKKWTAKQKYEQGQKKYEWLAFLHRSEEGRPIKTSESVAAVRMVSIHAAQGDGRRLVLVFQLSESKLKRFSKGKKNLIYDSLLQVACSRAKSKLIIVLEENQCEDDIVSRFLPYCTSEQRDRIEPRIQIQIKYFIDSPLLHMFADPTMQKGWISSVFTNIEDQRVIQDHVIEYEHHLIRDCVFHSAFSLHIYLRELEEGGHFYLHGYHQISTVLGKLYDMSITTFSVKEYYNMLYSRKEPYLPLTMIPIVFYKGREVECGRLFTVCNEVKDLVLKYVNNKQAVPNLSLLTVLHYVALWYMISITQKAQYSLIRPDAITDIFAHYSEEDDHKTKHYQCIENAKPLFQKCCNELAAGGKWRLLHSVTLGTKDGNEVHQDFSVSMVLPFVYTTDTTVSVFHLLPNINSLRRDQIGTLASFTGFLLSQPKRYNKKDGKEGNRDRFHGKMYDIYFPCMEMKVSSDKILKYHWNECLESQVPDMVTILTTWIQTSCDEKKSSILHFAETHRGHCYSQYITKPTSPQSSQKVVDYIKKAMEWYQKEYRTRKKQGFSKDNIKKDLKDLFMEKLKMSLQTSLEDFRNHVLDEYEENSSSSSDSGS